MFTIIWSFRNRIENLQQSILTAHKYFPTNVNFCLVDGASSEESIRKLRVICHSIKDRKIRICESAYRTSLLEAWNLGMILSETRYVVFSSSDVVFQSHDLYTKLVECIYNQLEYVLVSNHAVFLFDKKAITKMGWFDETFVNGPHFDCDFMIKASEFGVKISSFNNSNFYTHISEDHKNKLEDRLPILNTKNDAIFKDKWETKWPGWENTTTYPHPPTHISQVKRKRPDVDCHPFYTEKFKTL